MYSLCILCSETHRAERAWFNSHWDSVLQDVAKGQVLSRHALLVYWSCLRQLHQKKIGLLQKQVINKFFTSFTFGISQSLIKIS